MDKSTSNAAKKNKPAQGQPDFGKSGQKKEQKNPQDPQIRSREEMKNPPTYEDQPPPDTDDEMEDSETEEAEAEDQNDGDTEQGEKDVQNRPWRKAG